jgi:uncharacterized protein YbaR (Trm112 family)/ubiquinone/menaquinone biosynthesis C-methylase UbiE
VRTSLLGFLRCPVCGGALAVEQSGRLDDGSIRAGTVVCSACERSFPVEDGIPRMLDGRLPGIREKLREVAAWPRKAEEEGWYRADDEVDLHLPFVCRDLGWDDPMWRANEYSFSALLEHYVRPGLRVLEVGAAKCWGALHLLPRGCEYVGTDILADRYIGLGRGDFYAQRVGHFERVQADGERLPFASGSFDLTYCVATLHHALDLRGMVGEMRRVTRPGGIVAALNEGTRALGTSPDAPIQRREKELGINEHVHTPLAYVWSFLRAGLVIRRIIPADGNLEAVTQHRAGRAAVRLPRGETLATLALRTLREYGGISLFASPLAARARLRSGRRRG